ncbi:MAG: methylated-DNA--[protein]-cysteine S-methyltransferase [Clostridia bacterium]|nr:methylated-DNA--[protein]-cysteine S-methyltransferase [Clostridia bacterium]
MGALGDEQGLAYIALPKTGREAINQELHKQASTNSLTENALFFTTLARELDRYFRGEVFDFSRFSLKWHLVTPYRQRVLQKTMEIPYGETRTYKWLAEQVGNPRGSRSVGQAMAHNPWPIVVPCHRVIGSNGKLTGFGGGLPMKEKLLALEAARSGKGPTTPF